MRFSDEAILRLVVAVLLGAVVGAEREANDQPAGLRTHIAVCLGAAVFGVVSTLGFDEFKAERASTNFQVDVTRVASQVVVGIGFLGAGIIFRERTVVKNLTTAASMWVTAAIGLTAGVGDLGTAAAGAAILVGVLALLKPLRALIRSRILKPTRELALQLAPGASIDEVLAAVRSLDGVTVDGVHVGKVDSRTRVTLRLQSRAGRDIDQSVAQLVLRDDLTDVTTTAELHD
jgi:putative Mg2+ transporter-C (MgtC) family protein